MNGRSRLTRCTFLCLLPLGPLAARLGYLQILEHRKMSAMAQGEITREAVEIVPRGRILDRQGRILAQSLPSWSSFIDPSVFSNNRRDVSLLAKALGMPEREMRRKAGAHSRFVWLKRKLNPSEVEVLKSLGLRGIGLIPDEARAYPNDTLARGILGTVGTDGTGLSGLELQFNHLLSGQARKVYLIRDGSGAGVETATQEQAPPAPDLTLTLDRDVQHFAEAALSEGLRRHPAHRATVVIQDPRTGDILAMATVPNDPLNGFAIQDAYEPGSTFKLVAMTGAIEEHLTNPDESIDTEGGRWQLAPRVVIRDDEPHQSLTVSEVMEQSSNIGMAKLGLRLGPERFFHYARAFGFGSRTGLPFPGESPGILKTPEHLTRVSLANNAFGQGVAVTPLQLVSAYSAIANGGTLLEPRLILGEKDVPRPGLPAVRQVASAKTVQTLGRMLESVVEKGTGEPAQIPGYRIAGKTGTAQKIDPATGKYGPNLHVASFIGYAPVSNPQWTILVVVDTPQKQYHGAEVAAPVFADVLRRLLAFNAVPPDVANPGPARSGSSDGKKGIIKTMNPRILPLSPAFRP